MICRQYRSSLEGDWYSDAHTASAEHWRADQTALTQEMLAPP